MSSFLLVSRNLTSKRSLFFISSFFSGNGCPKFGKKCKTHQKIVQKNG